MEKKQEKLNLDIQAPFWNKGSLIRIKSVMHKISTFFLPENIHMNHISSWKK